MEGRAPAHDLSDIHALHVPQRASWFPDLVTDFKCEVMQDGAPRLVTLRTRVLIIGAILGAEGRDTVLRLGLRDHRR